ncbi:hypothetical protein MKEN_00001300 [Mycena kentingensis (nom. inval.)]|nr:hypothetical protein MKEN_00001300 [Mycena kentingensis (nom. inval.)]
MATTTSIAAGYKRTTALATSSFLYPSGPAFRPRTSAGPAAYAARIPTKLAIYTAASDDPSSDSDDDTTSSDAGSESSASTASTAATSVYSVASASGRASAHTKPALSLPPALRAPPTAPRAPTRYLYEGGSTNVVSGGVMLSAAAPRRPTNAAAPASLRKPASAQPNPAPRGAQYRRSLSGPSATASSWRRAL